MNWFLKTIVIVSAIGLFSFLSYWGTYKLFQINDFDERIGELKALIKLRKRQIKKGELNSNENDELKFTIEKIQTQVDKTLKKLNPTSFAHMQSTNLNEIYHKCEKVFNRDDKDIVLKRNKTHEKYH
jgi:hypothetical protein